MCISIVIAESIFRQPIDVNDECKSSDHTISEPIHIKLSIVVFGVEQQ